MHVGKNLYEDGKWEAMNFLEVALYYIIKEDNSVLSNMLGELAIS